MTGNTQAEEIVRLERAFVDYGRDSLPDREKAIDTYVRMCRQYGTGFQIRKGLFVEPDYRPTRGADGSWCVVFTLKARAKQSSSAGVELGDIDVLYTDDRSLTMDLGDMMITVPVNGLREAEEGMYGAGQ